MKNKFKLLSLLLIANGVYGQAPLTNTDPGGNASGRNNQQYWSRGGNTDNIGTNNVFGTLFNSPIYTQTNGITRMTLMGTNPTGSITGALGLGTITPLSFLHLTNFTLGAFSPQGEMFRTDGNRTIANHWKMFTGTNAANSTEKFRITSIANSGAVEMGTVQSGLLHLITNNQRRITVLGNSIFPYNRTGFVGFNNQAPLFHLDIRTQNPAAPFYGELLLRARITDDDDAYISFVNLATIGPILSPALMGRQSDNDSPALSTVGSIVNWQDVATNVTPVTRFFSSKNYDPTQGNFSLTRNNVINNRRLFGWYNGVDQLMTMESNGHLGVGTINPGNRVEINSDFYDTLTGNPLGTFASGPIVTDTTSNSNIGLGLVNATGFSGLRFSDLTSKSNPYLMNPGQGVLALDSLGDVIYVHGNGGFGAACADTVNGKLQFDTKVDLNNHNLYFTNNDTLLTNQVGIGYDCGVNLPGKLSVRQVQDTNIYFGTIGGHFWNSDTANVQNLNYIGVLGRADGKQIPGYRIVNTGGDFYGSNADINYGIVARGKADSMSNSINTGGQLLGAFGTVALGSVSQGSNATLRNVGVHGIATSPNIPSSLENIAGQFSGSFSTGTNYGIKTLGYGGNVAYGIYATALGAGTNFSGYFDGVINSTAAYVTLSDSIFKTDVNKVESALRTLAKLQPKTYMMDTVNYSQFNFDNVKQYGFIAQEVEQVLPELVHNSVHPGVYDSLGNELIAPVEYKALNYQALIPINTQAIKELDTRFEKSTLSDQSIKTNVSDLLGSLQKVLDMRGVTYNWEGSAHPNLELDSNTHVGFIAQEIHAIDPLLTFMDEDTLMHVEYDKVVPILAEAISELNETVEHQDSLIEVLEDENLAQQSEIDDLNARLTQLENCLSGILPLLCQMNNSAIQPTQESVQEQLSTAINVTLSNRNNIVLNQNVPNPFAESTIITYSIPLTVQKAQIHFYDGTGKLINSVDITERGNGQLNVFANDLSTGVYTYSLVADGQIVSTKRMMKQ